MPEFWRKWKYPYLTAVVISIILAIYLANNDTFKNWLLHLGTLEYVGAFIAGSLFVSSFTTAISIVAIGIMAENINPFALALIGAVGSMLGDLILFRLIRDHLSDELVLLLGRVETSFIRKLLRSRYISWMLPILGSFIIASPLPDELGVSLLGMSKISQEKFIVVSYFSNAFGILMIASVAKIL